MKKRVVAPFQGYSNSLKRKRKMQNKINKSMLLVGRRFRAKTHDLIIVPKIKEKMIQISYTATTDNVSRLLNLLYIFKNLTVLG